MFFAPSNGLCHGEKAEQRGPDAIYPVRAKSGQPGTSSFSDDLCRLKPAPHTVGGFQTGYEAQCGAPSRDLAERARLPLSESQSLALHWRSKLQGKRNCTSRAARSLNKGQFIVRSQAAATLSHAFGKAIPLSLRGMRNVDDNWARPSGLQQARKEQAGSHSARLLRCGAGMFWRRSEWLVRYGQSRVPWPVGCTGPCLNA